MEQNEPWNVLYRMRTEEFLAEALRSRRKTFQPLIVTNTPLISLFISVKLASMSG